MAETAVAVAPAATNSRKRGAGATNANSGEPKPKVPKAKSTFMLHNPNDYSSLGKYQSTDFRYAALKVASRGHTNILLRKTNTKEMREFTGAVVPLDTPKEIHRGDRVIRYTKKPVVKFIKRWVYNGAVNDDEDVNANASANANNDTNTNNNTN